MNPLRPHTLSLAILACVVALLPPLVRANSTLNEVFANPPQQAKPHVMWMWMGSNLSEQGITRDLEALHEAGYGGTLMFSCADSTTPWPGEIGKSPTPEIVAFTKPWWQLVRHAAQESGRLGLDFGTASSPGYSTSGGPWITPELSML
jgi:alpha-L-rhamnosidase